MGVSFFETMQGHLVDRWGRRHPVDFDLKAEATHLRRFLWDGTLRATGTVHAPPWTDVAPVEGTIRIRPFLTRRLEYALRFRDDRGRAMALTGTKFLSPVHPFRTASTLYAQLRGDGELLGQGVIRFDLNHLLAFAAGWFPSTAIRSVNLRKLPADVAGSPTLTGAQQTRLCALAEAALLPGEKVPAPDQETLQNALEVVGRMPRDMRAMWWAGIRGLDGWAMTRYGRPFARLSMAQRHKIMAGNRLSDALVAPLRMGHFARRDYLDKVGVPDFEVEVREPEPPYMQRVTEAEELEEGVTDLEAEVVIVGSGAGGAVMASELAERGVVVALVEEGRYLGREHFSGSPLKRMERFYRKAGMSFSVGRPPISIPMGRLVGGTTAINSGTCFRVPDRVLAEWQREHGFPDAFAPEALAPYLDRVAAELQVAPNEPRHLGRIAVAVARGADAMGLEHGPLPRNAPGCDAQGVCIFGCPTGAKRSTNVSYVPRALEAGASLFTGLPVTRLLRRGRRVVAVEARGADRHGVPKILRIHAEAVVISCGSIHSPMMLWQNGYRNRWIGRNLSVHPGLGMLGMFDEPMEPWNAVPQGYGVYGYEDPDIKLEGYWMPPQLLVGSLSLSPAELTRWMDAQDRVGQYGFMVRDRNVGSVMRSADGAPLIRYALTDDAVARLQKGSAVLAELLLRGGAREVATGFSRMETVTTVAQARDLVRLSLNAMDFNLLGAHPLGTCRMGPHPEEAVVDFDHRVYGTDNLFVVDGSSVPTSLGVNPQMTIMALATRAAERLAHWF